MMASFRVRKPFCLVTPTVGLIAWSLLPLQQFQIFCHSLRISSLARGRKSVTGGTLMLTYSSLRWGYVTLPAVCLCLWAAVLRVQTWKLRSVSDCHCSMRWLTTIRKNLSRSLTACCRWSMKSQTDCWAEAGLRWNTSLYDKVQSRCYWVVVLCTIRAISFCLILQLLVVWLSVYDVGLWPADFPWPSPGLWLTGDHFVGKLSARYGLANQSSSALHPFRVDKCVVSHVITWIPQSGEH